MFLPLKDNIRTTRLPILTIALIVINCFVYFTWQGSPDDLARTTVLYGAVPYELMHSEQQCVPVSAVLPPRCAPTAQVQEIYQTDFPSSWMTIFTSMFLHVGLLHLFGNMLVLGVFGRAVEDTLGRLSFLLFYLVGGVGAVVAHTLYDASSTVTCVGASGAIAAVMAAYLVLFPRAKVFSLFIIIPCMPRAWLVLSAWLLEQAVIAWLMAGSGAPGGVAVFAHFGGFLAGVALTYLIVSREEIEQQRMRAMIFSGDVEPPVPPEREVVPPPAASQYAAPQPQLAQAPMVESQVNRAT